MADANRTLVTRAEYDTIIVPETGRKALVMDGETIELGWTGRRDITGLCVAGVVASGRLLIERTGYEVAWIMDGLTLAVGDGTTNVTVFSGTDAGITAFRPATGEIETHLLNSGGQLARLSVTRPPLFQVNFGRAGIAITGSVRFTTRAGWPSVLPGVADGEPVSA